MRMLMLKAVVVVVMTIKHCDGQLDIDDDHHHEAWCSTGSIATRITSGLTSDSGNDLLFQS